MLHCARQIPTRLDYCALQVPSPGRQVWFKTGSVGPQRRRMTKQPTPKTASSMMVRTTSKTRKANDLCNVGNWRLFRIMLVRTHAEGAAENPDHIGVAGARAINDVISWKFCCDTGHRKSPTTPSAPIISSV